MTAYPVRLSRDGNGTTLVDFVDFPEAHTFGETKAKALKRAVGALETVVDAYIRARRSVPVPRRVKRGQSTVTLPLMAELKLSIYRAMQSQKTTKSALARALHWHLPQVDRLLDIRHQSKLE